MGIFLFFLFFGIYLLGVSLVSYYVGILFFTAKASYRREELTEIRSEVFHLIIAILESGGNLLRGTAIMVGSAVLQGLWSSIGSILGDPGPGALEHIFHAPIFFLGVVFAYPFIKESLGDEPLLGEAKALFTGLALGNLSSASLHYGLDRDLFFLYLLFLFLLQIPILVFLWNRRPLFGVSFEQNRENSDEDWGQVEDSAETEEPFGSLRPSGSNDFGSSFANDSQDSSDWDVGEFDFDGNLNNEGSDPYPEK